MSYRYIILGRRRDPAPHAFRWKTNHELIARWFAICGFFVWDQPGMQQVPPIERRAQPRDTLHLPHKTRKDNDAC